MIPRTERPLDRLSDAELTCRLRQLASQERGKTASLVAHLAVLESRGLHLKAGYGSLFTYCRDALRLSEQDAFNRVAAARAARRFPPVVDLLATGAVTLTTVRLLAPHLTDDNHREVLESARGKTKTEVELIVARLAPWPDVPSSIRKLPSWSALPPPSPAGVVALAPSRYKMELTIGKGTLDKLRLARDLLRHAIPQGDDAEVLERALSALLVDLARKKFAAVVLPRPSQGGASRSRHVPAEVRRAVFLRDLGRCAFVGSERRRCDERGFLEFHHVRPYAAGGEATAANIELRCRRHNGYEARTFFGDTPAGDAG